MHRCMLIAKVCCTFDRYQELTNTILQECARSVYLNFDALEEMSKKTNATDFFSHQNYFMELKDRLAEKKALNEEM